MRRIAIMRTVTALPPPYGIWHLPYGMRAQLAQQFAVSTWTIYHDLKRLNAEDLQRFYRGLAQERERKERIMGARVTIRLPEAMRERLADLAAQRGIDLSELVRLTLTGYMDGQLASSRRSTSKHHPDACAQAVLQRCIPLIAERMTFLQQRTQQPLMDLLVKIINEDYTYR